MAKLTAARIRTLKTPGRHGDGDGLHLKISETGARSWILRVVIAGKRRDIGLGRYPDVGLAQAREVAAKHRSLIAAGGDPIAEKRKAAIPTFREAAERTFEANKPRWRNGKHTISWWQSLEKHAFPIIGDMPVDKIDEEHVLRILTPIWGVRMETARRVRQRIRTILKWAMAHKFVRHNVAGETIDGALPPMPKVKNHLRAMPYGQVSTLVQTVRDSQASLAAKWCLEFLILTAARSGEARGARWSEMDMDAATRTIPAERMKANVEHSVPLSPRATTILVEASSISDGSDLVFPSPLRPGKPMSDMTLTKLLRDLGFADRTTVHGFRSSFRDWAAECTSAPHAVMELSLAHTVGSAVEAAYARSTLIEKRRALMVQWATYLEADEGRVVPLVRQRG